MRAADRAQSLGGNGRHHGPPTTVANPSNRLAKNARHTYTMADVQNGRCPGPGCGKELPLYDGFPVVCEHCRAVIFDDKTA